jgi:hypothetical protein
MSSAIDATKPTSGTALTQDVRDNFSLAEAEINELMRSTEDSVTATGTADALVATFANAVVLAEGVTVVVKAAFANTTTTPTINVNATGAKTIVKDAGSALTAGDIAGSKHFLLLRYDATDLVWVLMNPAAAVSSTVDHDATENFVANEHINHEGVSVTAGAGLSGGGTIAATRTLNLDINSLTTDASPNPDADFVPFYDTSQGAANKVLVSDLVVSASSLSSNGYVTLANGLTVQWGSVSVSPNSTSTVTLPVAFSTAFLQCYGSQRNSGGTPEGSISAVPSGLSQVNIGNKALATQTGAWLAIGY